MPEPNHDILQKVRRLQSYTQRGLQNPQAVNVRDIFISIRDFFRDELVPQLTSAHAEADDAYEKSEKRIHDLEEEVRQLKLKAESKDRMLRTARQKLKDIKGTL